MINECISFKLLIWQHNQLIKTVLIELKILQSINKMVNSHFLLLNNSN